MTPFDGLLTKPYWSYWGQQLPIPVTPPADYSKFVIAA